MADAIWKEYELFCPVCNAYFKQLVVLHKVPKNFNMTPYLDGFVKCHDHKAWQEAQRQKAEAGDGEPCWGGVGRIEELKFVGRRTTLRG